MYSISVTLVSFSRACLVVAISILLGRLVAMDFLLQEPRLGEPFIASPLEGKGTFYEGPSKPRFTLHASRFTLHASRFTLHASRFTLHASRFTLHVTSSASNYFLGFQSRAICCALASWSGLSLLAM